jgi:hypothetical protein
MRAMKRIGSWSWELGVDRFFTGSEGLRYETARGPPVNGYTAACSVRLMISSWSARVRSQK